MDFRDKFQYNVNSKILVVLVLLILIVLNFLSQYLFVRFDWTENDQYSISDATSEILQELDDIVTVKAYFTDDLPAQFLGIETYVKDILSEYKAYSGGNFDYEFLDPTETAIQSEASSIGIQQRRMQVRDKDSIQVKDGYMGLGIYYEGKSEVIPAIEPENLGSLEYDLTSLIVKMAREEKPLLGFLQGHGEHVVLGQSDPNSGRGYTVLAQALERNYRVRHVDIAGGDSLEDVDVLVVAGPQQDLSERDVFEIDQFMLSGRDVIYLVDTVKNVQGGTNIENVPTNAISLLVPLGIGLDRNIVLDQMSAMANFSEGPGQFYFLPYPPFIQLVADYFSDNPIVAKMKGFVIRFVSSVQLIEPKEGLEYDPFIRTSLRAWTQSEGNYSLNPRSIPTPDPSTVGQKAIGMVVSGMMPRISDATEVPTLERVVPGSEEGTWAFERVTADPNRADREVLTVAQAEAEVIVMADADFLSDPFMQQDQTPLVLFLNMVDYLTYGDQLITIRSKSLTGAPIGELSDSERTMIRVLGIVVVPLLLSAYGFFRLWMRRKEEKILDL